MINSPVVRLVMVALLQLGGLKANASVSPQRIDDLIRILFEETSFEQAELSPDGSHLAFIREHRGRKLLATYDFGTGRTTGLASPDQREDIVDFGWAGPDHLAFVFGIDRVYYQGLICANEELQQLREVERSNRLFSVGGRIPGQPNTMSLREIGRGATIHPDFFALHAPSARIKVVERNPGNILSWFTDLSGTPRLAIASVKGGRTEHLYRANADAPWQKIDLPTEAYPVTFDGTGTSALLSYVDEEGRHVLQSYDFAAKKFEGDRIADRVYDMSPSVIRDPASGGALGLLFQKAKPQVVWLHPQYQKLHATLQKGFPGAVVRPRGVTQSGDVVIHVYSDQLPATYFTYDPKTGALRPILSSTPEASSLPPVPVEPISFVSSDGHRVHGYLALPRHRRPDARVPLITVVHGGPAVRDVWAFDPEMQFFAALGYGVLKVNYRGSTGYGRNHIPETIIEVGRKSVEDVAAGLRWAVDQGYADPKRLIAYGGSYGGYISVALAQRHPDLLACAIGFAGVYDWSDQIDTFKANIGDLVRWRSDFYPDQEKFASDYREISPVFHAAQIRCPILLLHGGNDNTVKINQSSAMKNALEKANRPVKSIRYSDGVHGFAKQSDARRFYRDVTDFLLKHAAPDPTP